MIIRMEFISGRKGITFAAALLLIFIILFVGFLAYLALTTPATQKTYFENLDVTIEPHKRWHLGVPIVFEGNLRLSFTANYSIRVYAKYSNTYLIDKVTQGSQDLVMRVNPSMGVVEVALVNLYDATISVSGVTCTLTS